MTRGIFNWTFDDVVRFLKDRDFTFNDVTGSHYFMSVKVVEKFDKFACRFMEEKQ